MSAEINWQDTLDGHPIFELLNVETSRQPQQPTTKLGQDEDVDPDLPRRRQLMCMKDSDLIVACGSEIRITSLSDAKLFGKSHRTYKILHTPSITFNIRQLCLNPNRKLVAVAGSHRVAVVVLPKTGFSKLVTSRIDCKSLQIGQYYHSDSMSPIVKIDWHPWGESGSTLLVMTADGKVWEYDVSVDPDEPRRTLDFVTEKMQGSYAAYDEAEREVASFTFGKGKADWGPLTLYALMKSGDVYAICPYLPENASVPSSYLRALECFVSAKEEFVAENNGTVDESFSTLYDYQRKYVNNLLKHLAPAGAVTSRCVSIHTSKLFPGKPSRQGPFFLQPAPPELQDSLGGDATDVAYMTLGSAFSNADEEDDAEASSLSNERLGVLLIAFQDGRVDVYLDLEKVEAKWDTNTETFAASNPTLTTYETIDLGIISSLSSAFGHQTAPALKLLESNHVVFYADPIHDDTIYAYHAFGVHDLNLNGIFRNLAAAVKEEDDDALSRTVRNSTNTSIRAVLHTSSIERRSTDPVTAVVIPDDVYLTYGIFILTSAMRVAAFSLTLRAESIEGVDLLDKPREALPLPPLPSSSNPPAYVSLLTAQPFTLPSALSRPVGLQTISKVPLPRSHNVKDEIRLTPETLRYLGAVAECISGEIHDATIACHGLKSRCDLQKQEFGRLQDKALEIIERTQKLLGPRKTAMQTRLRNVQAEQAKLLSRMDRVLQALIRQASPELNEHERKWFEELQRMKAQVLGVGRYDPNALKARIHQLQCDFDRLKPALKDLAKEEAGRKSRAEENVNGAGNSYAKVYERMSRIESRKMEDAVKQISKLVRKLEITSLSPPPV